MICEDCAQAADLDEAYAQQENDPRRARRPRTGVIQRRAAQVAEIHARCKGGTWCDCQHKPRPR